MTHTPKKLYRSKSDKVIAGVCGGLGEFFNLDPVLFRIIFVILAFGGGSGVLIYLIMMLVVPKESNGEGIDLSKENIESTIKETAENIKKEAEKFAHHTKHNESTGQTRNIIAILIILIGALTLLRQITPLPWLDIRTIGPIIIIFIGLIILFKR